MIDGARHSSVDKQLSEGLYPRSSGMTDRRHLVSDFSFRNKFRRSSLRGGSLVGNEYAPVNVAREGGDDQRHLGHFGSDYVPVSEDELWELEKAARSPHRHGGNDYVPVSEDELWELEKAARSPHREDGDDRRHLGHFGSDYVPVSEDEAWELEKAARSPHRHGGSDYVPVSEDELWELEKAARLSHSHGG